MGYFCSSRGVEKKLWRKSLPGKMAHSAGLRKNSATTLPKPITTATREALLPIFRMPRLETNQPPVPTIFEKKEGGNDLRGTPVRIRPDCSQGALDRQK